MPHARGSIYSLTFPLPTAQPFLYPRPVIRGAGFRALVYMYYQYIPSGGASFLPDIITSGGAALLLAKRMPPSDPQACDIWLSLAAEVARAVSSPSSLAAYLEMPMSLPSRLIQRHLARAPALASRWSWRSCAMRRRATASECSASAGGAAHFSIV